MNTSRTKILDQWCAEIEAIVERNLRTVYTERFDTPFFIDIPDSKEKYETNVYPDLSEGEKSLCREILERNYNDLLNALREQKRDWESTGNLGYLLFNLDDSGNSNVSVTVQILTGHLLRQIKTAFERISITLLFKTEEFSTDDLICLSNPEIITRGKSIIKGKSLLEQIKFLQWLRSKIVEYKEKHDELDYMKLSDRSWIVERNSKELFRWIEDSILNATPSFEFLSNAQIKILRNEIEVIERTVGHLFPPGFLIDRFDQLVLTRSSCLGKIDFKPFRSIEEIKKDSQPAVIIRYLVHGIQGFNPKYQDINNLKGLKIWISTLFDNVQGFSYDSVRKALERNKGKYKESIRP